jgi:glycosyltransferase involved in cell wall biosynthesis
MIFMIRGCWKIVSGKISVLAPDLSGGGGTRVYLLAQVLQKLNYDVTVFGFLFGERLYPPPPVNLTVKWVHGHQYPQFLNSVWQLLKQIDGDIIYAVKPRPSSFGLALLKRLQTGKPLILDIDDWEMSWFGGDSWKYRPTPRQIWRDLTKADKKLRTPDAWMYLQQIEKLVNKADAITVNTTFLHKRYGGIYLPNGKDTDLFNPDQFDANLSRQKYGLSEYRVLMFPGTARPHKGVEDILIALDQLNQPDLRLVVVGGREIKDGYLETLINRWPQWLIRLPQNPIEKMPEIVSAAHIVIVPQRNNPTANAQFPIKLTDGMAMAKPIISTRVGDISQILGGTGYLVEPNSPAQIATQIEWIFNNLEIAYNQGLKARERCIKFYSVEKMSVILSQIIKDLQFL